MPIRWYHGTFTLAGRILRLPTARGCPPLQVRLDRPVPYPAECVRSVTLLFADGRLDSLALFNLVLWIEERTGQPVDPTAVDVAQEWASVRDILAFVAARGGPER